MLAKFRTRWGRERFPHVSHESISMEQLPCQSAYSSEKGWIAPVFISCLYRQPAKRRSICHPTEAANETSILFFSAIRLFENPGILSRLPLNEVLRLEPESNLLLGALNAVGAVADVAANSQAVVATDGARSGSKGVGGTEDGWGNNCQSSASQ